MMNEELIPMTERLIADLRRIRAEEGRPGAGPLQVLIVDDTQEFAGVLKALFEAVGCQARLAGTVWDAEQQLREPTDIVSLDLNLPDGRGRDVFDKVRVIQPGAHIIVVTAYPALLDELPVGQYFGVCLKPIDVETLRAAVAKYRRPVLHSSESEGGPSEPQKKETEP